MTTRLTIVLEDDELREIQRVAHLDRLTTAEWVRRRLGVVTGPVPRSDIASRLNAVEAGYAHESPAPAPDISQVIAEIERGFCT